MMQLSPEPLGMLFGIGGRQKTAVELASVGGGRGFSRRSRLRCEKFAEIFHPVVRLQLEGLFRFRQSAVRSLSSESPVYVTPGHDTPENTNQAELSFRVLLAEGDAERVEFGEDLIAPRGAR